MSYENEIVSDATPPVLDDLQFRRSSYSSTNGGNCVEIAFAPEELVAIRDSKRPDVVLTVGERAFAGFMAAVGNPQ